MNRKWLYVALLLTALLLAMHLYALSHYLYWHYRWFDIPMHILGGIAIGAFLLGLRITKLRLYFGIMVSIVVCWELFEYIFGISTGQAHYWIDTIKDMIDGLLGATITYSLKKNYSTWH